MKRLRLSAVACSLLILSVLVAPFLAWSPVSAQALSPVGTYESCEGACGCTPKTKEPVVAESSVVNECGMASGASIAGNVVTAFAWHESATLSVDGSRLAWQDGSVWIRPALPIKCRVHETAVSGVKWAGLDTWYSSCAEACQGNGAAWSAYYHSQYPDAPAFSYGLSADGNSCIEYHEGVPYSYWSFEVKSLQQRAADRAKDIVGAPYLGDGKEWGGKGYNKDTGSYATPEQIKSEGYTYWNEKLKSFQFGKGVDCSGLVMWAYNGARTSSSDPRIEYQNADGQYRYNSTPIAAGDLQPGDLLFFGDSSKITHVAMYVGDGNVVEAYGTKEGVQQVPLSSATTRSNFYSYGRVTAPKAQGKGQTHSPVSLVVADPLGNTIDNHTAIETTEEYLTEVPGYLYYSEDVFDQQGRPEDAVTIPELQPGNYFIKVVPKPGTTPTDTYGLDFTADGHTITLAQNEPIQDIPNLGYGITVGTDQSLTSFRPVAVDVKADGDNVVHPGSKGKLWVAVLSDAHFDAPSIDTRTIHFGPTGTEASPIDVQKEDTNGDGLPDLLVQFNIAETKMSCSTTAVELTGGGATTPIWGSQAVRMTGCR